jgi:hypothetical protein
MLFFVFVGAPDWVQLEVVKGNKEQRVSSAFRGVIQAVTATAMAYIIFGARKHFSITTRTPLICANILGCLFVVSQFNCSVRAHASRWTLNQVKRQIFFRISFFHEFHERKTSTQSNVLWTSPTNIHSNKNNLWATLCVLNEEKLCDWALKKHVLLIHELKGHRGRFGWGLAGGEMNELSWFCPWPSFFGWFFDILLARVSWTISRIFLAILSTPSQNFITTSARVAKEPTRECRNDTRFESIEHCNCPTLHLFKHCFHLTSVSVCPTGAAKGYWTCLWSRRFVLNIFLPSLRFCVLQCRRLWLCRLGESRSD